MSDKIKKLDRYIELNKSAEKGAIVCAGSSLMEMFPVEKLMSEARPDIKIYNRGIGGYMTCELLENVAPLITDLKPKRLFINIGTNDLSWSSIPIEDVIENYEKIISSVEKAVENVEIYLMAYFPINYEAASEQMKPCLKIRTNEKINLANEAVKALAEKHGQKYIDINKNLKDDLGRLKAEYTIEGMHIKEIGYRAIFDDFLKYVTEPQWLDI